MRNGRIAGCSGCPGGRLDQPHGRLGPDTASLTLRVFQGRGGTWGGSSFHLKRKILLKNPERGDTGLFITLVPKVFSFVGLTTLRTVMNFY